MTKKLLISKDLGYTEGYPDKSGGHYGFVSIPIAKLPKKRIKDKYQIRATKSIDMSGFLCQVVRGFQPVGNKEYVAFVTVFRDEEIAFFNQINDCPEILTHQWSAGDV